MFHLQKPVMKKKDKIDDKCYENMEMIKPLMVSMSFQSPFQSHTETLNFQKAGSILLYNEPFNSFRWVLFRTHGTNHYWTYQFGIFYM